MLKNREKRLQLESTLDNSDLCEPMKGRVISRYGKHAIVETCADLSQHPCFIRRTIESVVCGDYVLFRPNQSSNSEQRGVIEAVEDRKTVLTRPDYYDGVKPIAANVDQIIIVSSILPEFSPHIIDRYLVACEDAKVTPVIVINKIELLDDDGHEYINEVTHIYGKLGYQVYLVSCNTTHGIDVFKDCLTDKVSVFVGQSGVGKSSIINALLPEAEEGIGDVSTNSGLGQHTTTTAKLLHFASGGELIDSPGVREFGLWHLSPQRIAEGFIEFRHFLGGCKFSDCKHHHDPGCLITQAVEDGDIAPERYDSFIKIIGSLDAQRPAYAKN